MKSDPSRVNSNTAEWPDAEGKVDCAAGMTPDWPLYRDCDTVVPPAGGDAAMKIRRQKQ